MAERRILVVANETVAGRELLDDLKARAADGAEVLVVAPALNTRLRHLFADVDKAREGAEHRLAESIEHLQASGIQARGAVGDSDPVRAIEDALFEFDADEIVISTHPREPVELAGEEDGRAGAGEVRRADHPRGGRPGAGLGRDRVASPP